MKKKFLTLVAAVFAVGTILSACNSSAEKVENAEQKVADAKADVKDAKQDLAKAEETQQAAAESDFQKFKRESNEKIDANDKRIAELKIDIKNEKREARERDEERIAALEKKNHELRVKLEAYHDDGKSDWREFKTEFNHDLEGIGHAFKDITIRNTK
jgi:chromosome segregation ATPase